MSEAAAIFGVSTDQMNDPIDVGTFTEHDEMGAQCLLTTSGSADHTVNLKVKGEGSFRGGQDARTEFSDWMATQTRVPQQQVPDLADDAVCVTPGQGNHGTLLGVVVGSRLLFVLSLSNNDSCDTLQRLAAEAVRRIGG